VNGCHARFERPRCIFTQCASTDKIMSFSPFSRAWATKADRRDSTIRRSAIRAMRGPNLPTTGPARICAQQIRLRAVLGRSDPAPCGNSTPSMTIHGLLWDVVGRPRKIGGRSSSAETNAECKRHARTANLSPASGLSRAPQGFTVACLGQESSPNSDAVIDTEDSEFTLYLWKKGSLQS